jgi:hypothetical protein
MSHLPRDEPSSLRTPEAVRSTNWISSKVRVRWALVGLLWAGLACLGGSPNPDDEIANDPERRAERIVELRAGIERDHAVLQDLISRPRAADEAPIYDDPEVRAIAARMTNQVDTLERLEAAARGETRDDPRDEKAVAP